MSVKFQFWLMKFRNRRLVKDWFLEASRRIVDGNLGMFMQIEDADVYAIDPRSEHVHSDSRVMVQYYNFVGR